MATPTIAPELKNLALDLTKPNTYPRSPREMLGGYVIAARILDKCRAILNGTGGEYNFDCPLDRFFFDATGIDSKAFEALVATGASDEAVAKWIQEKSKFKEPIEVVRWNNEWRFKTPDQAPERIQLFLEEAVFSKMPTARLIYFFDALDMDEKRLQP